MMVGGLPPAGVGVDVAVASARPRSTAQRRRPFTNERYFIAANAGAALVGQPLSAIVTLHASF
jgi:hypothetical protein